MRTPERSICRVQGHAFEGGECVRCGYLKSVSEQALDAAFDAERHGRNGLDEIYRNGGSLVEDRNSSPKDLIWEMGMARGHPNKLAADLAAMGWDGSGDDPYEHGEPERN